MHRRKIVRAALVAGVALLGSGAGAAAQTPITLSEGPYEVDEDKRTVAITVGNASDDDVLVALAGSSDCKSTAEPETVEAHRSSKVTFTLTSACRFDDDDKIELTLSARPQEGTPFESRLTAQLKKTPSPKLSELEHYRHGAKIGVGLVAIIALGWLVGVLAPPGEKKSGDPAPPERGLLKRLPGIASDWSFADSWSSNVGLGAAVFTGVLGASDVLKEVLGEGSEAQVSTAVISAGITAAMIGAAPLLLAIVRNSGASDTSERAHNVVAGVLLASAVVLAATIGQILVMAEVVVDAGVVSADPVTAAKWVAIVLLILYALQTIPGTLTDGLVAPKKEPSDTTAAAAAISAAILKASGVNPTDYPKLVEDLPTSPGDDRLPHRRPRSAMP